MDTHVEDVQLFVHVALGPRVDDTVVEDERLQNLCDRRGDGSDFQFGRQVEREGRTFFAWLSMKTKDTRGQLVCDQRRTSSKIDETRTVLHVDPDLVL